MKTNNTLFLGVGISLSAIALFFAFKNVPFGQLVDYMSSINYFWMIPSILVVIIAFILRALRWQLILKSVHDVSYWRAYHPMMIGFMINCIFPGRVGEVARPVILKKNDHVPVSSGLATVAVERVFDVGILVILFAVMMMTVQVDPGFDMVFGKYHLNKEMLMTVRGGMVKLIVVLIAGILIVSTEKFRTMTNRLIIKMPVLLFFLNESSRGKIKEKICIPFIKMIENFASGFSLIKYPKEMSICVGLSLAIWGLSAFSYYILAIGSPGIDLSFMEIFSVMIIVCFFIAIPSVPGFWGIWEAGGVFALSLFGIPVKEAAGFTLANHVIQIFPVIIMGFVSALMTGVNIWQVIKEKEESNISNANIVR
ncbi:MAG: lysylphosphatidylglycerol synthase transmembrane domain-containing protein [Desulfobacterales bacterium]